MGKINRGKYLGYRTTTAKIVGGHCCTLLRVDNSGAHTIKIISDETA